MKALTRMLQAAVVAFGLGAAALAAAQGSYPAKPVRFVVPYPPGGASDVIARLLAEKLTQSYRQSFVVENRPGANGIIALEAVAKSEPDGYTILMGNVGPNAINAGLYPRLPFDPIKSFAPITLVSSVPIVLLVGPTLPVKTTQELIAYARKNPGKVQFGSGGPGSATHLTAELFKKVANIDISHVPYKGDVPAMTDVQGGHVGMTFATSVAAAPFISGGKLRVLGTASKTRPKSLAQYPTIAEQGVQGFESTSWGGVLAPAGTPGPVVDSLNRHIIQALELPEVRARLAELGADVSTSTPQEFATYLASEIDKWSAVIKSAGVTMN